MKKLFTMRLYILNIITHIFGTVYTQSGLFGFGTTKYNKMRPSLTMFAMSHIPYTCGVQSLEGIYIVVRHSKTCAMVLSCSTLS